MYFQLHSNKGNYAPLQPKIFKRMYVSSRVAKIHRFLLPFQFIQTCLKIYSFIFKYLNPKKIHRLVYIVLIKSLSLTTCYIFYLVHWHRHHNHSVVNGSWRRSLFHFIHRMFSYSVTFLNFNCFFFN